MIYVLSFFIFLIGLAVGSFLNVVIDRLPLEQSIITPPSHCPHCRQRLRRLDLVPVLSYLLLRGRCRYCHAPIPRYLPAIEAITGVIFLLFFFKYDLSILWLISALYSAILITVAAIDIKDGIIPNKITYPAYLLAIILSLLFLPPQGEGMFVSNSLLAALYSSLLGGAVSFLILFVPCLVYKEGMGWGDVKLAGLTGFMLGFPSSLAALAIALISGGIMAAVLLLTGRKKRKQAIPFGPFLSLGALAALAWGQNIVNWYLGFF